jgi:hypothetical protein
MQYQIHPPREAEDTPLPVAATWLLYYTDNETINDNGSITITPEVSISGDDGGFCAVAGGFHGFDIPSVMLHGNSWQVGPSFVSGGQSGGGEPVQIVYAFPNVTIPASGESVDLSYASHVEGECSDKNPNLTSGTGKAKRPAIRLASF